MGSFSLWLSIQICVSALSHSAGCYFTSHFIFFEKAIPRKYIVFRRTDLRGVRFDSDVRFWEKTGEVRLVSLIPPPRNHETRSCGA